MLDELYSETMKICSLNVNCWGENNGKLQAEIVKSQNADVICISETHLKGEDEISLHGY